MRTRPSPASSQRQKPYSPPPRASTGHEPNPTLISPLSCSSNPFHIEIKKNLGFPISIASPIPTEARDEESKDVHCWIVRHPSPIGGRVPSLLRIRCRAQPRILRLVGQRRLRPSSLFASSEQLKSFLSPLVRICVVISIFIWVVLHDKIHTDRISI